MSENFNLEIVTPDRVIFKSEANQVTIPSFEGLMSILKAVSYTHLRAHET